MSRVGLLPIAIPRGTEVKINGSEVVTKGSKGELGRRFHPAISIALKDGCLIVTRVFPMASEADALKKREIMYTIYTRAVKYTSALITFIAVILFVGSHQLLTLWLGVAFAGVSGDILQIHVVTFSLIALLIVPWQIVDGLGFPGWNAFVTVLWIVIDIPLVYWFTPRWGVTGVATARLIAVLVTVPIYFPYVENRVFGRVLWDFWGRIPVQACGCG